MKASCYQCGDRKPGCHGSCERYAEYLRDLHEMKAATRVANTYSECAARCSRKKAIDRKRGAK